MRLKGLKNFAIATICSAWFLCAARADDLGGRVFDSQGAPVAATRVLGVLPASQVAATTSADGKFVLKNMPPGFVDVIALHSAAVSSREYSRPALTKALKSGIIQGLE